MNGDGEDARINSTAAQVGAGGDLFQGTPGNRGGSGRVEGYGGRGGRGKKTGRLK